MAAGTLGRIYSPPGRDGIVVYAGDLEVVTAEGAHAAPGQLELHLYPEVWFGAHFKGALKDLGAVGLMNLTKTEALAVRVPRGASLSPPAGTTLPAELPSGQSAADLPLRLPRVDAGELGDAARLVFHFAGALRPLIAQGEIEFAFGGWDLALRLVESMGEGDFDGTIEAQRADGHMDPFSIEVLSRHLFVVLGLVAGREVAIGPVCALDGAEKIVWARWGSPRFRPGSSARWCPPRLVPQALPKVAAGYTALDAADKVIIDRAVNVMMAADSSEVLDVRIPVATSGLELLSWATLRRRSGLSRRKFEDLNSGAALRQFCEWARIPTDVPRHFESLQARQREAGDGVGGPEIVFGVRNRLVHPPRDTDDPDWPEADELVETWQLATWYLQLGILRILGYDGEYWSRLRLGRSESGVESVPWV